MHKELTNSSVEIASNVVKAQCEENIKKMESRNQKDYIECRDKICEKYRKSLKNKIFYKLSGSSILQQTNDNIMDYLFKYRKIEDDDMMSIRMYKDSELQLAYDYLHDIVGCSVTGFYEKVIRACSNSKTVRLSIDDYNRIF